ncbi:TRSP domain C terminus to PRTase_2 [Sanguibacter gelidistatuariae]|uniref:TRSP domain C terminus to PRTase_2 n=1 Tax=Sanguibacter gelidistatuariae TaxID=1814289 RepID=A0A1G6HHY5_9MICO|nr:phosphoribosyltransferase family protein [Sanguibacter gelidistatuariae]SDB93718.1 TRSP domain C terminus to PRTase_2 [Sanguibacter gelidistatuariae]
MTAASTWVSERLGVGVHSGRSAAGISLDDLVGLAIRRNPRRAHLLVSTVLGKHVPTDPRLVYAAGRLLGFLAAGELTGTTRVAEAALASDVAGALARAVDAEPGAAARLLVAVDALHDVAGATPAGTVVVGYAETATALGHCVGEALAVPSLHSTRRPVPGVRPAAGFAEEHSHATEHLLLPEDPSFLTAAETVVLVDDEISTGRTALNTIEALQADRPRGRYVVAALIDLRTRADRETFAEVAARLGTRIDVVTLATGEITLPAGILDEAARLVAEVVPSALVEQTAGQARPAHVEPERETAAPSPAAVTRAPVTRFATWPAQVRDGGRHGFLPDHEAPLVSAAREAAAVVGQGLVGDRVLVLGFEELMYAPLRIAQALADQVAAETLVRFSTTTRSPVLSVDDPGYAIRTTVTFPSHDDPDDGPGPRFAHNVAPGVDPARRFTDIVVVIDSPADTAELSMPGGLIDRVAGWCDHVHVVVIPAYRP